jgi:hypothetical protein
MKHKQDSNYHRQQTTRRNFLLGLLPALLIVASAGCKQNTRVAAEPNPVGTYALVSVDEKGVPCTLEHEGHKLAVKSGVFVINADGTCTSKVLFAPPSGGDVTRDVKATYTRQGSKLTMKWEGAGMTSGSVQGDEFTMNNEGMVFAYRKQTAGQ